MATINDLPSRERWLEIEYSVTNSKFRENKKGETFMDYRTKYKSQIEKETDIIFANCIVDWLGAKIKLTKILDDLVNAMADDTNHYNLYLQRYFTQSQKEVRNVSSFTWNRGRRLFYIILDIISPGRNILSRAIVIPDEINRYQTEKKSVYFDGSMQKIYESKPKRKLTYFNPISLFKIPTHKRLLSKWFMENKVFDIEGDDQKLTPSEYLQFCYNQICAESGSKDLSHDELKNLKNKFTRKFRPWLVDSINKYWFDVMIVAENKKHHKTELKSEPLERKQFIKSYDRYTLCLIIHAWFESESSASFYLDLSRNIILKAKFEKFFPKSESHYVTANKQVGEIDEIIKKVVNPKQEVMSELELASEEIDLKQRQEERAWQEKFSNFPPKEPIPVPVLLKENVTGHSKVISEAKRPRLNPNSKEYSERKTKMKDWEKKIWEFRDWAFRNSHIPKDSRERIESVIASKIELIKRFKNPVTYE